MKKFMLMLTVVALGAITVTSCGSSMTDEERQAEIDKRVQEQLTDLEQEMRDLCESTFETKIETKKNELLAEMRSDAVAEGTLTEEEAQDMADEAEEAEDDAEMDDEAYISMMVEKIIAEKRAEFAQECEDEILAEAQKRANEEFNGSTAATTGGNKSAKKGDDGQTPTGNNTNTNSKSDKMSGDKNSAEEKRDKMSGDRESKTAEEKRKKMGGG